MKRTKNIRHASFRKNWKKHHISSIVLAISVMFLLVGCEKSDKIVSLYQNADNFTTDNNTNTEPDSAQTDRLNESKPFEHKSSKEEESISEFSERQCQQEAIKTDTTQNRQEQSNNSFWIPLITGYMMGRSTDVDINYQHKPIFDSKTSNNQNTQYNNTNKRTYDINQTDSSTVTKKTILSPEQKTTVTITRGGFGDSIKKTDSIQRKMIETLTMGA